MKRLIVWVVIAAVVVFVVLQVLPLNRTNPPVTREVNWDSPQTRALAQRACFDCHSNETTWPTYAYVAPVSLLVWRHVTEGRQGLNFSEWNRGQPGLNQIRERVDSGDMPPWDYLLMHPAAKLTDAEKQQLLAGFEATYTKDRPQILQRRHDD